MSEECPKLAQIDPLAVVHPGATIGAGTRVWQYSVVMDGAVIGVDCNLNAHTLVEDGAVIGDRVTLKCGVYVWDGVTLEDDVFVGPNAVFTNDKAPRSRVRPDAEPGGSPQRRLPCSACDAARRCCRRRRTNGPRRAATRHRGG